MHETSTGRDVYVKPAQVGASSYFICDFLIDCITIPGTTAVIISYDEFITGRLLRKAKNFYDILLERIPSIPELEHKSTYEKTFKGVNSSFYISSARSFAMPRGEPIHNLMLDEFAFWPVGAAGETFAATLQRVPLLPNTKVRILSTPNGEDNDFFEIYAAAKEGKAVGKSIFKHHFYTWFQHPEYSMAHDSPFALPGDGKPALENLDEDEVKLMIVLEQLGIDSEEAYDKLRWRRYKIAEMSSLRRSGETRLLFGQEFPEDEVSCFITIGDPVFDQYILNSLAAGCAGGERHPKGWTYWIPPDTTGKTHYIIGADSSAGAPTGSYAAAAVLDDHWQVCATFQARVEPNTFAAILKELGLWYNIAQIAIERNFTGYAVLAALVGRHNLDDVIESPSALGYSNVYRQRDFLTGKVTSNLGWWTNVQTKEHMRTALRDALPRLKLWDIPPPILRQLNSGIPVID